MKVRFDWDESSPHVAMLAAHDVSQRCKELSITVLHIKLRATGGNKTKTPGPSAQSALRALARSGMKIGIITLVTKCHLVTDPHTKESRGFAFVTMETNEDAERCIKYLNRFVLEG